METTKPSFVFWKPKNGFIDPSLEQGIFRLYENGVY
jgi:hypothetical protein